MSATQGALNNVYENTDFEQTQKIVKRIVVLAFHGAGRRVERVAWPKSRRCGLVAPATPDRNTLLFIPARHELHKYRLDPPSVGNYL